MLNQYNNCGVGKICTTLISSTKLNQSKYYKLLLSDYGNMSIIDNKHNIIFSTNTHGKSNGIPTLRLEYNGNLVLYNTFNIPIWESNTFNPKGYKIFLANNGVLYIIKENGVSIWNSQQLTNSSTKFVPSPKKTISKCKTYSNSCSNMTSPNGLFKLTTDFGNITIMNSTNTIVWMSGNPYYEYVRLILQPDGNILLQGKTIKHLLYINKFNQGTMPFSLNLQNDGNLQLTDKFNNIIWNRLSDKTTL